MQTQKLSTRAHYRRGGIRELDVFGVVGQRSLYLPPSNTNHVMCSAEQLTIGFALIRFNKQPTWVPTKQAPFFSLFVAQLHLPLVPFAS